MSPLSPRGRSWEEEFGGGRIWDTHHLTAMHQVHSKIPAVRPSAMSDVSSNPVPIIDSQVHAYERDRPERPWAGTLAGPSEVTGADMVAAMDDVGVDGALLVSPYSMYRYDAGYALEVQAAHPGRFGLIKPFDPRADDVAEQVADWGAKPGVVGARIMLDRIEADDGGLDRVVAAARHHGLPVNVLCWGGLPRFAELARRNPDAQLVVDHIGLRQPFTPPVLATHTSATGIFTLGQAASTDIQAIAENGNNAPLNAALSGDPDVHDVVVGMAPIVPANDPGGTSIPSSATFMITSTEEAKFLSFSSMLICTNDGFTGLDTLRLPTQKMTVLSVGYDARTEKNTEDFIDMVPPCQGLIGVSSADPGTGMTNPLLAETGIIIPHPGIIGGIDLLPGVHGWTDPVAKIVIEPMDD